MIIFKQIHVHTTTTVFFELKLCLYLDMIELIFKSKINCARHKLPNLFGMSDLPKNIHTYIHIWMGE